MIDLIDHYKTQLPPFKATPNLSRSGALTPNKYSMGELRNQANPIKRVVQMTEDFGYSDEDFGYSDTNYDGIKLWKKGDIFILVQDAWYRMHYTQPMVTVDAQGNSLFPYNGLPNNAQWHNYLSKYPNAWQELNPTDYADTWYHQWQRGQYNSIEQAIQAKERELAQLKEQRKELDLLYGKPIQPIL